MVTKGLGKGLGALISMFDEENEEIQAIAQKNQALGKPAETRGEKDFADKSLAGKGAGTGKGVLEVQVSQIDNNVNQPRKNFDPVQLQELAESIKANGVFQPILLNKVGSRFVIVAGERRWRAAKMAGLNTIPAIVREFTPSQMAEIAIVENLQRADLNEVELARGIKKLMEDFFLTQEQVSARIGRNRSSVANTLRILYLPPEVIRMIELGELSAGHAKCLVALDRSDVVKIARQCVDQRMSVRALENHIAQLRHREKPVYPANVPAKLEQSKELREVAHMLKAVLGTSVTIKGSDLRGQIIIDFYNPEDLQRIYDMMYNPKKK